MRSALEAVLAQRDALAAGLVPPEGCWRGERPYLIPIGGSSPVGVLGYVVPAALVVCGALVLARELRPPGRPLRTGAIFLTAAITLALAAGMAVAGSSGKSSGAGSSDVV